VPRMFLDANGLTAEETITEKTRTRLTQMGHTVTVSEVPIGGGQIIWRDRETGCFAGGSEPRKDGFAAGY